MQISENDKRRTRYNSRVSPPNLNVVETDVAVLGVLKDEENQDSRNSNAGIEGSGQNVVVLGPPREMTPADNVLEDESNDGPGNVVDRARRGDITSTGEDYGEAEIK